MQLMREEGLNPYANDAKRSISNDDFLQKYAFLKSQEQGAESADSNSTESKPMESQP